MSPTTSVTPTGHSERCDPSGSVMWSYMSKTSHAASTPPPLPTTSIVQRSLGPYPCGRPTQRPASVTMHGGVSSYVMQAPVGLPSSLSGPTSVQLRPLVTAKVGAPTVSEPSSAKDPSASTNNFPVSGGHCGATFGIAVGVKVTCGVPVRQETGQAVPGSTPSASAYLASKHVGTRDANHPQRRPPR
jgi:hypothetical protein